MIVEILKVCFIHGKLDNSCSELVPPSVRKTGSMQAFNSRLHLKGASSRDISESIENLLGQDSKGFSSSAALLLKK